MKGAIPTVDAFKRIERTVKEAEERRGREDRPDTRPNPRSRGGGGSAARQLVFVGEAAEFITCKSFDGTTVGTEVIKVAKRYSFRVSSWKDRTLDGVAYSQIGVQINRRSASDGTITQIERIIPRYGLYGSGIEIVYAIRPSGGTGVVDGENKPILLVEVDREGAWGKERPA